MISGQRNEELWVPFKECPHFIISNTGRLINTNTGHERKLSKQGIGYLGFTLFRGKKSYRMHVCVAEHFIDKPDNSKTQVNHKDFNRKNNHWENLEWVTAAENSKHSFSNGRHKIGSNRFGAKLNEMTARTCKEAWTMGFTLSQISQAAGVSPGTIKHLVAGRSWSHVTI